MAPGTSALLDALRDGLMLALLVSLPVAAVALAVGLIVGALQTATQLGDPTIGAVPCFFAIAGVLARAGSWTVGERRPLDRKSVV